ncbi:hypothetical protein L2E82_33591 [Cichorium intybus]|uniref:Uncharacterized protein n=1 Tax=Cichorium intybus TaxID=13427 RepID=A0ACB9BKK3_CICIN|nr:hypothetical protein L2E82_33591 [Cichorium intybus]
MSTSVSPVVRLAPSKGSRTGLSAAQSEGVWYDNIPHTRLVEDKGGQNWISRDKDKFVFPGGGTLFIHGPNQYLEQISKLHAMVWGLDFKDFWRPAFLGEMSWSAILQSADMEF